MLLADAVRKAGLGVETPPAQPQVARRKGHLSVIADPEDASRSAPSVIQPGIFKANDIRGLVGVEWDAEGARSIGAAFADAFELTGKEFVPGARHASGWS